MKKLLLLLLIFAISTAYSEENYEDALKSNFVNNSGRDFWFTVPPAYLIGGTDNFIKIFVFSEEETEVTVSVPGLGYKELKAIPKNNVVVYNITPATAQVKIYNYNEGPLEATLHRGRGINVSSESLITVYCVVRYSATSDGFLCLPTNALGNSYVASSYSSRPIGGPDQSLPNMVGVTATEDNTRMSFTLGGNGGTQVPLGGGKYLLPGDKKSYMLDRGDVVVFSNRSGDETLTGSLIEADKNISVVSAHYCADIPVDNHWCDYNGEMDLPIHTWGKNYHIPAIQNRKYSGILRIMAAKDSTTIYRDGYEIGFINDGKGGFENSGWIERRVLPYVPDQNGVALYSGDKPIYIMFYNPGTQEDGNGYDPTDPFSMALTPIEQYQKNINITAPVISGDAKGFSINNLILIYALDDNGNQPKDLELGEFKNGEIIYKTISADSIDYHYVTLDEVNEISTDSLDIPSGLGNKKFVMATLSVSNSVHSIRSSTPIACYIYGGDPYDSYGYPLSMGLRDLTVNDTLAPVVEWEIDCLGSVEGRIANDLPENDSNRSDLYDIRVIKEATFNFGDIDFEPMIAKGTKVIPSHTKILTWGIEVENQSKEAQATIMFLDRAGNYTVDTIKFIPQEYSLIDDITGDDKESDYGRGMKIGDKVIRKFIITNHSDKIDLIIDRVELKYGNKGFKIIKQPDSTVKPLKSTTLEVEFTAEDRGKYEEQLGVGNSCFFDYSLNLSAEVQVSYINVSDVIFEQPFNIADSNAKPISQYFIINTSCDGKLSDDVFISNIDDTQLPPEFSHNIPDTFSIKTYDLGTGKIGFTMDFYPKEVGKYEGKILFETKNGGCDTVCLVSAEAIDIKSVEDKKNNINIHPNLVKDELNISFIDNSNKNYDIQLVDMTGNVLYSVSANSDLSINMNKYSAGLYFVLIKDKHGKLLRKEKIIKQ